MRPPDQWKNARVTLAIVLVTSALWLLAALFGLGELVAGWGAFWPGRPAELAGLPLWLTPLTATLIHAGIVHLLFNMVVLAFCGRPVESVLGPASMAILYALGAYAAAAAQYAIEPAAPMVGASGAISAVVGAYAMLFGRNKVRIANATLALWLNALWLMAAWVVLQICMGIVLAGGAFLANGEGIRIAVGAHIGGFMVGVLLANPLLLFRYRKA